MKLRTTLILGLLTSLTACTVLIYPPEVDSEAGPKPELPSSDIATDTMTAEVSDTGFPLPDTTTALDTAVPPQDTGTTDSGATDAADTGPIGIDATPIDAVPVDIQQAPTWYWLGTTNVVNPENPNPSPGTLIVSHNALALFPIDLEKTIKNIDKLGPSTMLEVQTLGTCFGNTTALDVDPNVTEMTPDGHVKLISGHQILTNINGKEPVPSLGLATIHSVQIEMPYFVPGDDNKRVPGTFCYGYRKGGEWIVNFDPIVPTLNEVGQKGTGTFDVNIGGVDAFFILVDKTVAVNWIKYQATAQ